MIEYQNLLDHGERYVPEWLSGDLWGKTHYRWAIVDRNTGELMRKMTGRKNESQPSAKGKFIWRGDRVQAEWWCDRLNADVRPRQIDAGSGPEMQARRVDVGVIIGQARKARRVVPPPAVFVRCDTCSRCHRPGACPR